VSDPVPVSTSQEEAEYLRVSAGSDPLSLAMAISHSLDEVCEITVRAVGAGAVNQAVKAIAIARGRVASGGRDLTVRPGFQTITSRDGEITSMIFRCAAR
jgi:stage V sporulation protein S